MVSTNASHLRFQDRTVFITGAAHGMGRAHALAFAREGARLVLCDACRQYNTVPYPLAQPSELASLVSEIEQMGRPVLAAQVDVTDLAEMQELAEQAQHNFGPIDIVVANAGLYSFGPSWELTEAQWNETVNLDLKGVWITCNTVPRSVAELIALINIELDVDGHRGDIVMRRAAQTYAAYLGETEITAEHVYTIAPMALAHRLKRLPLQQTAHTMNDALKAVKKKLALS